MVEIHRLQNSKRRNIRPGNAGKDREKGVQKKSDTFTTNHWEQRIQRNKRRSSIYRKKFFIIGSFRRIDYEVYYCNNETFLKLF